MGRRLKSYSGLALLLCAPGVLVLLGLRAVDELGSTAAVLSIATVIAIAAALALVPALSLTALVEAIERLGPKTGQHGAAPRHDALLPAADPVGLVALRAP